MPDLTNVPNITKFGRANLAFRNRDYVLAVALYNVALEEAVGPLRTQIEFNCIIAKRRLGLVEQNLNHNNYNELDVYEVKSAHYVPRLDPKSEPPQKAARVIAFYLPQFHPIPENDKWWGEGFTEWTNVRSAQSQFEGHYQPHVPDDYLGYYDLRDTSVMRKQIELANQYGIEGFCFYTYWFSGHRLLETPVDNYLADPTLDLPFCICWANENWSRRWDGLDQDLLMVQNYSKQDDLAFIAHMSKYLRDPRYIQVEGKPLLIVYRPNLFPNMRETSERWRAWCRNNGLGEIYLAYVQSFECVDPAVYGLDAAIEFPPNNSSPKDISLTKNNDSSSFFGKVYDWRTFLRRSEHYSETGYTLFRGVCPSWDNTARKKGAANVFANSSPELFTYWLANAFENTKRRIGVHQQRFVFINAWNEWAEGAHLEADKMHGYAWLQSIKDAHCISNKIANISIAIVVHVFYLDVFEEICNKLNEWYFFVNIKLIITTVFDKKTSVEEILDFFHFNYEILVYENRGRDVLPFVSLLDSNYLDEFEYVIKVHTKKSLHRMDGDLWRKRIYDSILSEEKVVSFVNLLESNHQIALISPNGQLVHVGYYLGSNKKKIDSIILRNSWCAPEWSRDACFVAGTMFMARGSYLKLIAQTRLSEEEFEVEAGQVDGTTAHAIERILGGVGAYVHGYSIYSEDGVADESFQFAEKV